MRRYRIPGATIAIVRDDGVAWTAVYGTLHSDDLLPVHSISKSVTARGVLEMHTGGILDLDDPVHRYLGDVPFGDATVRQLLSHRGGLPLGPIGVHFRPHSPVPSPGDRLQGPEFIPGAPPGAGFRYSNTGYAVVELVVEAAAGTGFQDAMERYALQPLGMDNATFHWYTREDGMLPPGHDHHGSPVAPYRYGDHAAGGLAATTEDIARFVRYSFEPTAQELHRSAGPLTGIYSAVAQGYGLGHFVETTGKGYTAVFHGGQGLGWMTHFHSIPELREGIVIITDSQRSWPFMGFILRDWSRWCGAGAVGMERIVLYTRLMAGVIALVALGTVAVFLRRTVRVLHHTAHIVWPGGTWGSRGWLCGGVALCILLAVAATRDYLVFASVFPRLVYPAAASMVLLAGCCVLYSSTAVPPPPEGRRGQTLITAMWPYCGWHA